MTSLNREAALVERSEASACHAKWCLGSNPAQALNIRSALTDATELSVT